MKYYFECTMLLLALIGAVLFLAFLLVGCAITALTIWDVLFLPPEVVLGGHYIKAVFEIFVSKWTALIGIIT